MRILNIIAFITLLVGGINWLLIGVIQFDLVAFIFGGMTAVFSRLIYILVGLASIWLIIAASVQKRITFSSDEI